MARWPDARTVDWAARDWAERERTRHPEAVAIGYHGSYARGAWGPGSDLDLIVILAHSDEPFMDRPLSWELATLPVPAELLVYTLDEWRALAAGGGRFVRTVQRDAIWLIGRPEAGL